MRLQGKVGKIEIAIKNKYFKETKLKE